PDLRTFLLSDPPTAQLYTLSLHDALPISADAGERVVGVHQQDAVVGHDLGVFFEGFELVGEAHHPAMGVRAADGDAKEPARQDRSEEHTSELQSRENLVCRLLLEKKKKYT